MKFNKLFFAALSFAALTMISCEKKPEPVIPTPGGEEEVAPEMPAIANPGEGKTTIAIYAEVCPRSCYLVGTSNSWAEADDALLFEAMNSAGAANWYVLTVDYDADFQGKVLARPSDEDVPMGWSYQWGKNYDPNDPGELDESVENTKILGGTGEFVYENQGQPKLIHVADNGVIYIWVKNWAASPVIEAKKLETCWCKSDLNGADWTWYEMTAKGDGLFELAARWGGNGLNINSVASDEGSAWYPNPELVDAPAKGDSVLISFQSEKMNVGTLTIKLLEKGEAPVYEYVSGKIFLKNFGSLTNLNIYGWATNKGDNNEIFGAWPGTAVGGDAKDLTQIFYDKAIKDGEYKFIINGEGGQTADPDWTVTITGENTISLMINDENQLVLDN